MKNRTNTAMMRIAIAGAGGFAYILAQEITKSANAVLVLSRQAHPEFEEDFPSLQVAVVDFGNVEELRYVLQGVDLLISTISAAEQLNLIDAARRARVRLFVPSEFEGSISHRPATQDPLDRGSQAALGLLQRCSQSRPHSMQYTVFSCGLFMERFGPGGLQSYNLGGSTSVQNPNDYIVDVANATGEIIETNVQGRPVRVNLTSVYDVARFVAAAIELGPASWPREFCMRGDNMSVRDIITACSTVRRVPFNLSVHSYQAAEAEAEYCQQNAEWPRWHYFQRLLATANGRYHFTQANLNDTVNTAGSGVEVRPLNFRQWLEQVWGPAM
ncbi:NAD(P)-binding protein [Phialemonium atrogriseum]|uniref:NAD(P)-binding protein n=1 Tax=Phialemonium atrogriseum TaxID=1093897 RepID=A0AAJ0FK43_9PEZI|nr:NAD(P)-binding protein [Phialemonium atrogriseum]KAK1771236.1 NAD(P)-binding protein [Phialemonium atrogriseum]